MTEQAAPEAEEVETGETHRQPGEQRAELEECWEQQVPVHLCLPGRSGRGRNVSKTKSLRALSAGKFKLYKLCVSTHLTRKAGGTKFKNAR